jgi:hypothetical protein
MAGVCTCCCTPSSRSRNLRFHPVSREFCTDGRITVTRSRSTCTHRTSAHKYGHCLSAHIKPQVESSHCLRWHAVYGESSALDDSKVVCYGDTLCGALQSSHHSHDAVSAQRALPTPQTPSQGLHCKLPAYLIGSADASGPPPNDLVGFWIITSCITPLAPPCSPHPPSAPHRLG